MSGHKLDHLAIKSTTALAGKAGFTRASAATAVVEFVVRLVSAYCYSPPKSLGEKNRKIHLVNKLVLCFQNPVKCCKHMHRLVNDLNKLIDEKRAEASGGNSDTSRYSTII